jgi:hypothetical protein
MLQQKKVTQICFFEDTAAQILKITKLKEALQQKIADPFFPKVLKRN